MMSPKMTPPKVESRNATRPRTMIKMVCQVRKVLAAAVAPTEVPSRMVMEFIRAF